MHNVHKVPHLNLSVVQANEMVTFQALLCVERVSAKEGPAFHHHILFPKYPNIKPQESAKTVGS